MYHFATTLLQRLTCLFTFPRFLFKERANPGPELNWKILYTGSSLLAWNSWHLSTSHGLAVYLLEENEHPHSYSNENVSSCWYSCTLFSILSPAGRCSFKSSAQVCDCFSATADSRDSAVVSDARQHPFFHPHLLQLSANNQKTEGTGKEKAMWIRTYSDLDARELVGNSSYLHKAYVPMQADKLQDHRPDEGAWTQSISDFFQRYQLLWQELLLLPTKATPVFRASPLHSVKGALEKSGKFMKINNINI